MKELFALIMLFLSYCLFFYGLFSFVILDADYHNWTKEARFVYASIICVAAFWIIVYIIIENKFRP